MVERREPCHEESHYEAFAEELAEAVQSLKLVSWDAIRRERFSLTPEALYHEIARTAATLISRHESDARRRQDYLQNGEVEDEAEVLPTTSPFSKDKFGLDLDLFKEQMARLHITGTGQSGRQM